MKRFLTATITLLVLSLSTSGCGARDMKEEVREVLKKNPSILVEVIKENPTLIMEALQEAANKTQREMAERRQQRAKQTIEAAFNNPLKPVIRKDETIRGAKDAPLVLVEYSDFECPYCAKGTQTVVHPLLKKYEGKIQVIYKHLPLSFHPQAMNAARYYEAVRLQSDKLAFAFHDKLFQNARQISQGEKFFLATAKSIGVNIKKLKSTLKNKAKEIDARIQEDMAEAAKFGLSGTPGFILNGIPVKGAYPLTHFEKIIALLQQKKLVKL